MNDAPSLQEIHDIVARRRRNRGRVAQGAVGVVLVAGLGYGLSRTTGDRTISAAGPASEVSGPIEPTTSTTSTTVVTTVNPPPVLEAMPTWLRQAADGYAIGLETQAQFDETKAIADDWGVDLVEAKALLGVADGLGLDLDVDADDALVDDFLARGGSFDEASAIASEWQVSPLTVKMLAALDVEQVPLELD